MSSGASENCPFGCRNARYITGRRRCYEVRLPFASLRQPFAPSRDWSLAPSTPSSSTYPSFLPYTPSIDLFETSRYRSNLTMRFTAAFTLVFAAFASAAPVQHQKRAPRSFSQISIGGGVGGNALAEAQAKFPGTAATLSAATTSDFNVSGRLALNLYRSLMFVVV